MPISSSILEKSEQIQISKFKSLNCFGHLYFGLWYCWGFDAWDFTFRDCFVAPIHRGASQWPKEMSLKYWTNTATWQRDWFKI